MTTTPDVLGLRADAVNVPMLSKPFGVEPFIELIEKMLPKA